MKGKKFAMSLSGGKDSSLAYHRAIQAGMEPVEVFTTYDEAVGRTWFHGISGAMLTKIGEALGVPLTWVPVPVKRGEYTIRFQEHIKRLKEEKGVEVIVFGDIDIEDHRKWATDRTDAVGLEAWFPLWQGNREALVHEFLDKGFSAILVMVELEKLPKEFCGKILTKELAQEIKATGSDVCGENGEYHTLAFDGPIFKHKIRFVQGDVIVEEKNARLELIPIDD